MNPQNSEMERLPLFTGTYPLAPDVGLAPLQTG